MASRSTPARCWPLKHKVTTSPPSKGSANLTNSTPCKKLSWNTTPNSADFARQVSSWLRPRSFGSTPTPASNSSAAEALPGVKGVWKNDETKILYVGQLVAAVAAETEEIATEAARLVKVQYNQQEHQVVDSDPELAKDKPNVRKTGDVEAAFADGD